MPAFEEAREIILANVAPLGREEVPLPAADGRVLAEEVRAPRDMPPWDNSAAGEAVDVHLLYQGEALT